MDNDFILVLDLGGPEAIEMARKLRNQHYYTEIISRRADIDLFRRKSPRGILIVGGEAHAGVEPFPKAVLALGIPVLALGGAARMMIEVCGAKFEGTLLEDQASQLTFADSLLFDGLSESDRYFARVDGFRLPEGFKPIATTMEGFFAGFADLERSLYGLQFYAESNDPDGATILSNFAEKICGCNPIWAANEYLEEETRYIQDRVGEGHALMAVSGGVDSATCALMMRKAIGDRLHCIFIDNGLMREGEADQVEAMYKGLGIELIRVNAADRFLERLRGIADPVDKHHVVYSEFQDLIYEHMHAHPELSYYVIGTIYTDLLLRGSSDEVYARHFDSGHRLEPVRMLFKDEIKILGELLGLTSAQVNRQAFPTPGLAVRCVGEVTPEKLSLLRKADAILREEIRSAGAERKLSQFFAVLTDSRTLGRRNGSYAYEYACAVRAVQEQNTTSYAIGRLPFDLLDRVASRIIAETPGINRVVLDISPDDYAAIEWE